MNLPQIDSIPPLVGRLEVVIFATRIHLLVLRRRSWRRYRIRPMHFALEIFKVSYVFWKIMGYVQQMSWGPHLEFLEVVDPGYPFNVCRTYILIILKRPEVDETQTSPDSWQHINVCKYLTCTIVWLYIHIYIYLYMILYNWHLLIITYVNMSCNVVSCHVTSRHVLYIIYIYRYDNDIQIISSNSAVQWVYQNMASQLPQSSNSAVQWVYQNMALSTATPKPSGLSALSKQEFWYALHLGAHPNEQRTLPSFAVWPMGVSIVGQINQV